MEKENIFLAEERRTEKEEKEKFLSWKMYFMEEKKDGEGKEENIRIRKMFPLRDKRTTTNKERWGYQPMEGRNLG